MKKYLALCILTIIIFRALTISTAKIDTAFYGDDSYGFPLTYFIRFGGMCSPCPPAILRIPKQKNTAVLSL